MRRSLLAVPALMLLLAAGALAQQPPVSYTPAVGGGSGSGLGSDPAACTSGQFVNDLAQDGTLTCAQPGNVTGNAATATALSANPADCSAGQVALGITAAGVATCTATPTVTSVTGALVGNASTATALAADGANCSAGNIPLGVDTAGAVQGCYAPTNSTVGLGSVTNDAQTKASVVPNTAPSAGQVLAGNAGGTAYAPVSLSRDCTLASTGAITCTKTNNVSFATSATTDTTSASNISTGTLAAARGGAGTISGILKGDGAGVVSAAVSGTDYAAPPSVAAKTGATYTTTATDSVLTNTGNAGGLAITLLNDPTAGTTHRICVTAAQSVSIAPSAGETLYFNATSASSISTSTVGSCVTLVAAVGGSGGIWIVTAFAGPVS